MSDYNDNKHPDEDGFWIMVVLIVVGILALIIIPWMFPIVTVIIGVLYFVFFVVGDTHDRMVLHTRNVSEQLAEEEVDKIAGEFLAKYPEHRDKVKNLFAWVNQENPRANSDELRRLKAYWLNKKWKELDEENRYY